MIKIVQRIMTGVSKGDQGKIILQNYSVCNLSIPAINADMENSYSIFGLFIQSIMNTSGRVQSMRSPKNI